MGAFITNLLVPIGIILGVLVVFGIALRPHFTKVGLDTWKAFVPVYNIFTWGKVTKGSFLLPALALWWLPMPLWWMIVIGTFAYVMLVLDTRFELYKKVPGYWLWLLAIVLVSLAFNAFGSEYTYLVGDDSDGTKAMQGIFAIMAKVVNLIIFVGGFILLLMWGGDDLNEERYFSKEFSFKQYAITQFKRNTPARLSTYVLGLLVLIAVYAPYIANDQPLFVQYRGETYFPAHTSIFEPNKVDTVINEKGNPERIQFDITNWKTLELDKVVWAPVTYSPGKSDRYNRDYVGPFGEQRYKNPQGEIVPAPGIFRHHLGTDVSGADVFSGLIHGTRISLIIGIIAMGIATFIGILLGSLAGFFGDSGMKAPRINYWLFLLGLGLMIFYMAMAGNTGLGLAVFFGIIALLVLSSLVGFKLAPGWLGKTISVPMDSIVLRVIEILNSLPRLLIIITLSAIFGRSMVLLMVIIGATSWTGIARFTRAEFLRTRSLEYIDAAKSLGYNNFRVIFQHALPNSMAPVFVAIAFGIASAILVESGLSFLGIGVPDDIVTWGQMLSKGRQNFEAGWLVWFPGLAIFITVTVYNLIGEALRDALDPKLKQ